MFCMRRIFRAALAHMIERFPSTRRVIVVCGMCRCGAWHDILFGVTIILPFYSFWWRVAWRPCGYSRGLSCFKIDGMNCKLIYLCSGMYAACFYFIWGGGGGYHWEVSTRIFVCALKAYLLLHTGTCHACDVPCIEHARGSMILGIIQDAQMGRLPCI